MTVVEAVITLFHGSVVLMGAVVLWHLRELMRRQLADQERRAAKDFEAQFNQAATHDRRVIDAANDWYDDKKGSKERLRAIIAQSRGIEPYQLIQREGGGPPPAATPIMRENEPDCPECANGMPHETCRSGWKLNLPCGSCGAPKGEPCDTINGQCDVLKRA